MTVHRGVDELDVFQPGDEAYGRSVRGFYGTRRPAVVVRPRDVADVGAAVRYAVRRDLVVTVRSGGHGPLTTGAAGEMLIDLTHLCDVEVLDVDRRLVRIGGGATWGQVASALDPYGWAVTAGDTSSVGVGGLTLGGGIGWLVRRYGLAIDNLVGARVVTADGRLVTASADEHPDLFWALRGGGGNFGVVVDFVFAAQPVSTVHFCNVTYRLGDPALLIRRWRDAARNAPDALSSVVALTPQVPGEPSTATVLVCAIGEPDRTAYDADTDLEPFLQLGTVDVARIDERRYADLLEDAPSLRGVRPIVRNTLVDTLDDAVIREITHAAHSPVPAVMAVRSLGGACGRVARDVTAFAHRDAEAMITALYLFGDDVADTQVEPMLRPWHAVAAHGTGTYLNFQGTATRSDLARAYPPTTYARLAEVKRHYDPGNRFAEHNIDPNLT